MSRFPPTEARFEAELSVSRRGYFKVSEAASWEEIWEAGPYYDRISELLEDATRFAVFVGWQIDSRLPMKRPVRPGTPPHPERETLKEKLVRLCEEKPDLHIHLLMWDHAYFYVMERESWQGRVWEDVHPRVHFVFDSRHPFGGSHHEKIALIDGKAAFCGGIDLCDERWDSRQHLFNDPRRSLDWKAEHHTPYHDLAVQVTGRICADIHAHIAERWRRLSSIPFPEPLALVPKAGHRVYFSRTLAMVDGGDAQRRNGERALTREIEFLFRDLIRAARHQLVFEGQYYWSRELNDLLIAKMHEMRGKDFTIFLALADLRALKSLTRHMAEYQLSLLAQLERTSQVTGTRLIMGSPYAYSPDGQPPKSVYIHSKILICDDRLLSIGSANLAARALRVDTEVMLTLEARGDAERAHIRRVRDQVYRHWGVTPDGGEVADAHVRLRRFRPIQEIRDYHASLPPGFRWLARFPWQLFLDPTIAWLYPVKRRFRWAGKRRHGVLAATAAVAWALSAVAAFAIAVRIGAQPSGLAFAFTAALASAWILEIPFAPTALWASVALGSTEGPVLAASGLWVCALWGYTVARMFPTTASRYARETAPRWLPRRLGLRRFPVLVSVVFDPRVSLRSKIAFEGIYCMPFAWYALIHGLVLPAALVMLLRSAAWMTATPDGSWRTVARQYAPLYLGLVATYALARLARFLWKRNT